MFDHAQVALNIIVDDFKKILFFIGLFTQICYMAYLVYALIAASGNVVVNAVLLALSVAYFVFTILAREKKQKKDKGKTARKTAKLIYKYSKIAVKLYPLAISIYGLYHAAEAPAFFSVLLLCFTLVGWILQIVLDLFLSVVGKRLSLLKDGLSMDVQEIKKPVDAVGNFFKKISGKEIEMPEPLTTRQLRLKERVEAFRAEKKAKKAEKKTAAEERQKQKKQEKQEEKVRQKQLKNEQKASAAIEKKLLKAAQKQDKKQAKKNAEPVDIQTSEMQNDEIEKETAVTVSPKKRKKEK